jgi:hypothetical protein
MEGLFSTPVFSSLRTSMKGLERKKELVLHRELLFANAIGGAVFEKPKVSFWMVLIPILFVYFLYRMQKYKNGRLKFDEEFMITRRRAMDVAFEAVATGGKPAVEKVAQASGLSDVLQEPYRSWVGVLVDYYMDLLAADGESFDSLVRSAYRSRGNYLLVLNRLNTVEKEFYTVLRPQLSATEGAADIIATIETQSQRLRRDLAETIFA